MDEAITCGRQDGIRKRDDTYKLHARDIVALPLTAELVTLSACHSAGARAFAGEGLVGLAWGFLSAGAERGGRPLERWRTRRAPR